MENFKNILGNNKILLPLIIVLLIVSGIQSVFLIKLYKSVENNTTIANHEDRIDKHFGNQGDILKHFDLNDHWDPFEEFQSMREQMERMFDDSHNRFKLSPFFDDNSNTKMLPETDLQDEGDHYLVTMNIPGSDETEIKVDLEGDTLIVSAQTKTSHSEKNKNSFLQMERSLGSFQRSMTLPGPIDASGMKTEYEDGVLTIILPKAS